MPIRNAIGLAIVDIRNAGGGLPPVSAFDDLLLRSTAVFMFGLPFMPYIEDDVFP